VKVPAQVKLQFAMLLKQLPVVSPKAADLATEIA